MESWSKRHPLTVNGYGARGYVGKVKGGYDVVITMPFKREATARKCLNELHKLKEVSNEAINAG